MTPEKPPHPVSSLEEVPERAPEQAPQEKRVEQHENAAEHAEQIAEVTKHLKEQAIKVTLPRKHEKDNQMRKAISNVSSEHGKRMDEIERKNEALRKTLNRIGGLGVSGGVIVTYLIGGYGMAAIAAVGTAVIVVGWGIGRGINAIQTKIKEHKEQKEWENEVREIQIRFNNMPDAGY